MEAIASLGRDGVFAWIGFTSSSMSSWKRFSGRGDVKLERFGLYVMPEPMPTSILFGIPRFNAPSMLLETVRPSGDAIGLSRPEPAGLIRRSWMLPAGEAIRIEVIWLIDVIWLMLIGGMPLLGSDTEPQWPARASEFTRLATGLVSCAVLACCAAATMLHICCRRPWATAATAAAAAAPGETFGSDPLLQLLLG